MVPKFETVIPALKSMGVEIDESKIIYFGEGAARVIVQVGDDIAESAELRTLIDQDITEANQGLENYESIKKYVISNRRFLEALDEVTPTLKNKHRNILKNFAAQIEEMYK